MLTAAGLRFRITARCGFPRQARDGRRIAAGAGCGSRVGAGPGFPMSPGVGRLITMAAGSFTTVRGYGGRGQPMAIPEVSADVGARLCVFLRLWRRSRGRRIRIWFGGLVADWAVDTFYPWYGRYRSRYTVVNITTINNFGGRGRGFGGIAPLRAGGAYSNLRLASMNQRVREGISTVPTGQFGTGRSRAVAVNGEAFRGGRRIEGNLPVVPTRAALSVSNRPVAASTLPRGREQQHFFSQSRPAAAPRSFDKEVAQMRQSIQRSGNGAGQAFSRGERLNQNSAVARPTPGVRTSAGGGLNNASGAQRAERGGSLSDNQGWRRFSGSTSVQHEGAVGRSAGRSSPAVTANVPRPGNSGRPEASTNDGGWRHFTPQSGGSSYERMNGGRVSGPDFSSRNQMSRPERQYGGGRGMAQESPRGYSRPPLEMRQPIVMPRVSEGRGSAPRESAPSRGGGGGGGGSRGGSGGGSHGGSPHGGGGRR